MRIDSSGVSLDVQVEGEGRPVVLLHGFPDTKRLWSKQVPALVDAGFQVIVPDQRGFGESTVPPTPERYLDLPLGARDLRALLAHLGHESAVVVGGDQGCGVTQDAALRFPGLVRRQVLFNGTSPVLPDLYAGHGIPGSQGEEIAAVSDHKDIQGGEPEALTERLGDDRGRIEYVKGFYQGRSWREGDPPLDLAGPGSFDDAAAEFMAEPFGDAAVFRSSVGYYEAAVRKQVLSQPSMLDRVNEEVPTLILYGTSDQIVGPLFTARMEVAHRVRVGPYLVEEAGHFLQWERADVLNRAIASFCADLL
jgi:pimeloyl-ACP methyl ester carboxylesterase